MNRFRLTLLAGATVLFAGAYLAQAEPAASRTGHAHHAGDSDHARSCALCMVECESCLAHCAGLLAGGHKEHAATLSACNDCADLCRSAASLAARGVADADAAYVACAEACDRCVELCGRHDDPHMKACAESCHACAAACRSAVGHAAKS